MFEEDEEALDHKVKFIAEVRKALYQHGFDLIKPIGDGGFATIILVRSRQYNENFVVKLIDLSSDPGNALPTAFEAEIGALSNLCHPNVIQFFDYFTSENCLYIILEYCSGGSIKDIITQCGYIRPPMLIDLCRQIIDALAYCHSCGVTHRDIKPANILIDKYGRAKLADFGLAQHFGESQLSQWFGGSLAYMSPEILKKKPFDPMKADIWALGVTFYEMASGILPWEGTTPEALSKSIKDTSVKVPPHFLPKFSEVLRACLHIKPDNRLSLQEIAQFPVFSKTQHVRKDISHHRQTPMSTSSEKSRTMKSGVFISAKSNSSRQSCLFAKKRFSSLVYKKPTFTEDDIIYESYDNA